MKFKCRVISKGKAKGIAIISKRPLSIFGDIDLDTGVVVAEDSDIRGLSITNKVLVFPYGRGSTVGTYALLRMRKKNTAPIAIINKETEVILAVGAIIAEIPLVDRVENEFFETVSSGDKVFVNADEGYVEILDD